MSATRTTAPMGAITVFRVVTLFERASDAFTAWRRARKTARLLAGLSDRQLVDIGLIRGDIRDVADSLAGR